MGINNRIYRVAYTLNIAAVNSEIADGPLRNNKVLSTELSANYDIREPYDEAFHLKIFIYQFV